MSWLYVRGEREVVLRLGPGINPRLWLNGRPVHEGGSDITAGGATVSLSLRDGWNTLVARPAGESRLGVLGIRLEDSPHALPPK